MTTFNPSISNGTCYYAENTETKSDFVPCGNSAIQAWPCCKLGSFCLSLGDANACWEAKAGNTYIAGCTDPSFGSPNCGRKPPLFHEQEWVPINQACKDLNTNSKADNVTNWTGCKIDDDLTDLIKLPLAACTPYCNTEHIIYAGSSSLAAFASLPTLRGSSIFWQNNYVPPSTPAPGYAAGTPTGIVGTFEPTATATSAPSSSSSSELSAAAKAGVGVGAAVGGLLVIFAIAGLFMLCLRRRRDRRNTETAAAPTGPGYDRYPPPPETATYPYSAPSPSLADAQHHQVPASPPPPPFTTGTYPYHYQQAPRQDAEAYTGYKSELPADERFLPGHSPQPSAVSAVSAASPPPPGSSISPTPASAYGNTSTYESR
ncbi:hypothetical protein QBC39DRAFT_371912 [Podospora conica]|nr:hypothetical protein QBC39DRAFT_371912 [Schizothecium conicum]